MGQIYASRRFRTQFPVLRTDLHFTDHFWDDSTSSLRLTNLPNCVSFLQGWTDDNQLAAVFFFNIFNNAECQTPSKNIIHTNTFNSHKILQGKYYYYSHFPDKESERRLSSLPKVTKRIKSGKGIEFSHLLEYRILFLCREERRLLKFLSQLPRQCLTESIYYYTYIKYSKKVNKERQKCVKTESK